MTRKKWQIWTIFGTRPETIKMAPVVRALQAHPDVDCRVCVTAQHRHMLDQVLEAYDIHPDYDLDIMQAGQQLTDITVRVLEGLRPLFAEHKPDLVLVHGDTSTAFAAALAAFYASCPIGHVEAGLRTFHKYSPYPEELNRQMISALADLHFAPTEWSRENLLREHRAPEHLYVTGNTSIDALHMSLARGVPSGACADILDWASGSRLVLLTAHRRENLGDPMRSMFRALERVVCGHKDLKLVYPVHLNPLVREAAEECFGGEERVRLIEPLDVLQFHHLLEAAYLVVTDSGGIQEEAPALGKPVVVLRDTTERPEGLEAGTLLLAGTEEENIYKWVERLVTDEGFYAGMAQAKNPYGDGHAAERIATLSVRFLEEGAPSVSPSLVEEESRRLEEATARAREAAHG